MPAEVSLPLAPSTAAKIPQGKEALKPQFWRGAVCSLWSVLLAPPPSTGVPWTRVTAVP